MVWDKMNTSERLEVLKAVYPFDYMLNKPMFVELASKQWRDIASGSTKNYIEVYLLRERISER